MLAVEHESSMAAIRIMSSDYSLTGVDTTEAYNEYPVLTKKMMDNVVSALNIYPCSVKSLRLKASMLSETSWVELGVTLAKCSSLERVEVVIDVQLPATAFQDMTTSLYTSTPTPRTFVFVINAHTLTATVVNQPSDKDPDSLRRSMEKVCEDMRLSV